LLRAIVSMIVLCFLAVVVKLSIEGAMNWGDAAEGLAPRLRMLFRPVESLTPYLQAVVESGRPYWTELITSQQRGVIISAIAATVGINMTFMFPYSMMRRGGDKDFRGLAIFDLSPACSFRSSWRRVSSSWRCLPVPHQTGARFVPEVKAKS
jgi:hypothetical protein